MRVFTTIFISFAIILGLDSEVQKSSNGFMFSENDSGSRINYNNPGFELKEITKNGATFYKPEMDNSGSVSSPGDPFLPSVSTYYAVEPGKRYTINISVNNKEIIDNVDLGFINSWDTQENNVGLMHETSSNENHLFPTDVAVISDPIIMRDVVVVQLTVTPFQYNSDTKELTVIHDLDIELIESENISQPFTPAKRSRVFEPFYESLVVNYQTINRDIAEYQKPSILYVLPSNIGNLLGIVEELFDWKRRIGYEVNYISSSNVVNNKNNLKNYIENAYETWENPPEYVTIIGDAEGSYDIPTWNESWSGYYGEGDHPYSQLEGNDQYPEVFLGRISFDTQSHLTTQISKLLNYESSPYMGENWFTRACLTGDASTSGISCVITNEHIHEILDLVGFDDVNTIYSGSFPNQMTSAITQGISFFNYRGYYGVSGFESDDVNNTSNGFMLPVATVITCGTGSFASGESLIEDFTRAGTASNPKGSVVCIGTATLGTHTMFNNVVDMGFYYGGLIEGISSAGGALMYGKMMLHRYYPTNPNDFSNIFTHWNNLIGDASLQMWSAYPKQLNASHAFSATVGTNYIDVVITSDNNPVNNAWVTLLMDDDVSESVYTNLDGFARIPIAPTVTGEVLVTATKHNHYPYQSSFQVYDPGVSVHLDSEAIILDDDSEGNSIGNGDGTVNGGEVIELFPSIKNFGTEYAENIVGVLKSENPNVVVIDSLVEYGNLSSNESGAAVDPFIFSVNEGLPDQSSLDLMLQINVADEINGISLIPVHVSGSKLTTNGIEVVGSADNVLTPGEESSFKIQIQNTGTVSSQEIIGTITTPSPFIEIIDASGSWQSIDAGGSMVNTDDLFRVNVVDETIPGATATLILNISTDDGYVSNFIMQVQIGVPTVNDPVGPDSYGYYIYDSGDVGYVLSPAYNWIEIDDRYGGDGSYLSSLSDNGNNGDDVETIDLPFTFRMYGIDYDQISICSNGWISMGETDMESFRNYELPGVGGPSPMVAVFWDDLKLTNGGRVYTWYDQQNKKFYVQWSRVRTYQNNSTENFQVVLHDPDYYLTPTGDGEILMQYEDFNNTSYGEYSWSQVHGAYCTVGIEDHSMTVGLQYTFHNSYHPAAMEIEDGTALLITTRGSDIRLDGDLNLDGSLNIFDILLLIDFILGNSDTLNPFLADANGDGMVNIMDMIMLIQSVMGW